MPSCSTRRRLPSPSSATYQRPDARRPAWTPFISTRAPHSCSPAAASPRLTNAVSMRKPLRESARRWVEPTRGRCEVKVYDCRPPSCGEDDEAGWWRPGDGQSGSRPSASELGRQHRRARDEAAGRAGTHAGGPQSRSAPSTSGRSSGSLAASAARQSTAGARTSTRAEPDRFPAHGIGSGSARTGGRGSSQRARRANARWLRTSCWRPGPRRRPSGAAPAARARPGRRGRAAWEGTGSLLKEERRRVGLEGCRRASARW